MEKYLKEIAKELKLIRIELQKDNDYYDEYVEEPREIVKPSIAEQLNDMFGKNEDG